MCMAMSHTEFVRVSVNQVSCNSKKFSDLSQPFL
ncbi:hypothetical protein T4C_5540 [Trichinella pseudospiralis]|uniref:Uncharacterized protein n=1 Tax=Trichinella pseudospiralis TaxID=6337 RepID=A0A0V1GAK4_TRIPS|nr:hypothetical protein T4C_5540 [Trichinella pseudospiralis]